VVELEACGICRSDWHGWVGDLPYEWEAGHVMGNEPAGHVVEVGEDVEHLSEEVHVPAADHNAVRLPDGVSSVDMAGLGCRFMTAFHGLAHRADVEAGDWVAVHGCGVRKSEALASHSELGDF
jgi:alcohol dehydrogenase